MQESLCPNCRTRFPDTVVHYDELVASNFSRTSMGYRGNVRSFASVSQHGTVTLCAACAARVHRMVRLRTLGAAFGNRGFAALAIVVVVFIFVAGFVPAVRQGVGLYVALAVIGLAVLTLLLGGVLALISRLQRPSATRFLRAKPSAPIS